MIPLVDIHCHLLAGLDDGPGTDEDALAMCRIAWNDGVRIVAATAHQNEHWRSVTPERIQHAACRLVRQLEEAGVSVTIVPSAEITAHAGLEESWRNGDLQSVAGRQQYLLVELPPALAVDLNDTVQRWRQAGIRPILAHPERHEELLHDSGRVEQLIRAGCLVQVTASSITAPPSPQNGQVLKSWLKRGLVHLVGSDGHSPGRRPPRMAEAYRQIIRWAGVPMADRVCSINATAIVYGLPLRIARPEPRGIRWLLPLRGIR